MQNMKKSQYKTEAQEQAAVIKFWEMYTRYLNIDSRLLVHVANERKTSPIQGAMLKAQGVRAGWPDLFLAIPAGPYHGLFIEMKSMKGKASDKQKEIIAMLREQGYKAEICHGYEQATNELMAYVRLMQVSK